MRRFALVVMPILAAVTILIGLYFIYVGTRTVIAGKYIAIGLGFAGFGAVGLILAAALWSVRKQILTRLLEPAAEDTKGEARLSDRSAESVPSASASRTDQPERP